MKDQHHVKIGQALHPVKDEENAEDNQPSSDKSRDDDNSSEEHHNNSAFDKGGRPGASPSPGQQSHRKARVADPDLGIGEFSKFGAIYMMVTRMILYF